MVAMVKDTHSATVNIPAISQFWRKKACLHPISFERMIDSGQNLCIVSLVQNLSLMALTNVLGGDTSNE